MEQKTEDKGLTNQSEIVQTNTLADKKFSFVEKVTMVGFFLSFLFCGSITLILLLTGVRDIEIITMTVLFLASGFFIATRIRWAPLATTLVGAILFYLVISQPYVITSLGHPRDDPQGGFGHFIGVTLLTGSSLLALVASIVAAYQNYLAKSRRTPRWLPISMGVITGVMIGALLIGALAPSAAAPTGLTYTNGVPTVHMSGAAFALSTVTITKGSKLLLVDDTPIEHIIANGSWQNGSPDVTREANAPAINSVQVSGGSVTIGPFLVAGTYHILCTIHQGMELTIVVQ